eukprot:TRINITY_DN379_c1_g2_i2.p3 TRINITY_DN379_c1_g2~~TRINITY_DN379_c1_g2_i2.p3  ORF type:complete len:104 (-),score=0.51 TRINITY_DN379_c1_g2_i2:150-461(-)
MQQDLKDILICILLLLIRMYNNKLPKKNDMETLHIWGVFLSLGFHHCKHRGIAVLVFYNVEIHQLYINVRIMYYITKEGIWNVEQQLLSVPCALIETIVSCKQ